MRNFVVYTGHLILLSGKRNLGDYDGLGRKGEGRIILRWIFGK